MRPSRTAGGLLLGAAIVWANPLAAQEPPPRTPLDRGQAVYQRYCATCHGRDGRGDTPVARLLDPRPRNFADPIEMARVTIDRIYHAVKEGRPGTAMAAWEQVLTETQIGDVIDYIRTLAPPLPASLSPHQLSLEVGRRIFDRECAECHGRDGTADTAAAKVLKPPPHNLADPVAVARIDDGRMYAAIKLGIRGTGMAGWGELLSPAEIVDVMRYVRSLERPLPSGMTRLDLDMAVGKAIYQKDCAACHGVKGDADTALGRALTPHPRNFTMTQYMAALPDAYFAGVITNGKPGTAMAPWRGILNAEDVRRVLLYIRRTFQGTR